MIRLLALDFDGVIADSAPESFLVAARTWCELRPASRLRAPLASLRGERAPACEEIVAHPLYAAFLELMPLGNRAEDYGVILAVLEAGVRVADQAGYDAFRDGLDRGWLRGFHKSFYRVRAAVAGVDPAGWTDLMRPYPGLPELLRAHAKRLALAIATAKDRRSVGSLLRSYGIDDLFPEDRVLDKETGVRKLDHLEHLHASLGVPYREMAFLEDKVNHLDAVAPLGVRCALAAWGYNGEREIRHARARGYVVCTLEDVEQRLLGPAACGE